MYVHLKLLDGKLPKKQTENSAGYDVFSAIFLDILPGKIGLVRLGFCIEIENGFEAQIRSRSGLALKNQVFVLNSPGTIDADYRGEVSVILMNLSSEIFHVEIGDRVAQLVFSSVCYPNIKVVLELSGSKRASGGFGSTG